MTRGEGTTDSHTLRARRGRVRFVKYKMHWLSTPRNARDCLPLSYTEPSDQTRVSASLGLISGSIGCPKLCFRVPGCKHLTTVSKPAVGLPRAVSVTLGSVFGNLYRQEQTWKTCVGIDAAVTTFPLAQAEPDPVSDKAWAQITTLYRGTQRRVSTIERTQR
jgi:hypothetical protein